jgi:hypothetical protein
MDAIAATAAMARSERERGVLLLLLVATMIGYDILFLFRLPVFTVFSHFPCKEYLC